MQDLHRIGIVYGDLEPRNIARLRGGFCLIDFSPEYKAYLQGEDTRPCRSLGCLPVNKVSELGTQAAPAPNQTCSELQILRNYLWERQHELLEANHVNLG